MDKQKPITIKINGKERTFSQTDDETGKEEQNPQEIKVSAWNETAAGEESADDRFDWILPDPSYEDKSTKLKKKALPEFKKKRGFRLPPMGKTKHSGNFPRIILNISLAVLVGVGFGLIILNTVTSAPSENEPASVAGTNETPPGDVAAVSEKLPPISTFIVQGGVFSAKAFAQEAKQSLAAKGIHGEAVANNGQFLLVLATAGSLEEAKTAAAALEQKGVEVFAKPLELPGTTIQGATTEETEVLAAVPELLQIFSAVNSNDTSKVETKQAQLAKIDDSKLSNEQVIKIKSHLEKGAAAYLANNQQEAQKEALAILAAWQAVGQS